MLSFGIAAQDTQKNLQMLSDITGGNNERFKSLTLAFSQMSSAGRLMGQDLLQMINVGFNPLQQISKTTGESMVELKKRMEAGGISAEEVQRAFADATAEGGMFHGMTDRLAQTVSGKLNIALSDLEQKLAAAGKAMAPLIMQVLDVFTRLQPILDAIVNLVDGISQGLAFAIAAVTDLINSVTSFSIDTTETSKFLDM
jgi:tape measure domain-containing protein